jgi:mono/diheme cytochrome c family protein
MICHLRGYGAAFIVALTTLLVGRSTLGQVREDSPQPPDLYRTTLQPFLAQHCLGCHGPKTAKAGYRIDLLGTDFAAPQVAEQWKEVMDRINAGEMPPNGQPRPNAEQTRTITAWVASRLRDVELAARNAGGRIPMRRLNRDEYANTVRDLLKLDERIVRPLIEELPADGQAEGFDRLGVALFFDQTQIERNLAVASQIANLAIVTEPPKTNRLENRFELDRLRPPPDQVPVFPGFEHTIPRGAKDRFIHPDHIEIIQGGPTYRKEYEGWGVVAHFAIARVVTQDGYYRFRIRAKVDDRGRAVANKFKLRYALDSPIQVEQEAPLDPSGVTETMIFLRGPMNGEVKGPQVFNMLWNHTEKAVITEPKYKEVFSDWTRLRGLLERAATERAPQAKVDALKAERAEVEKRLNAWTGVAHIYNPAMDVDKLSRLLLESIEIEGPIQQQWPPPSHRILLFDGDERRDPEYVREIFKRFLPRAYRRPVTNDEVESVVAVVQQAQTTGKLAFHDALRMGLQRILCSPAFLFLSEPAGDQSQRRKLNDYELASRLSYFLWSTMPDDELLAVASQGKLGSPEILDAQVTRMLADAKSAEFVRNFAGQWLSVRDYGSIKPAAEYRDYDPALEEAARREPFAFFAEVLAHDLPITNFLDSNFLVVNERLARHYGIDDVQGAEFRRVAIGPEHHRGGVLGMAGLMTYLADGTRTLPMRRGSWVLRELLNDPPNNPPPNAGEIQPNTAGKNLTVRERLELHRRDDVCASCHAKLDPYGLALENYDAIGAWRERFNGEGVHNANSPRLDVSGVFPDGRRFTTLEEYKAGLLSQKDRFARAFSTKMLTYALCRPVGYTDQRLVDSLVERLQKNDYRIQELVRSIVASETFQAK